MCGTVVAVVCVAYMAVAVIACDVVVAEVWCGSNSGACV